MSVAEAAAKTSWPSAVFDAAVLRGLDARGRSEIESAGSLRKIAKDEVVYREGDRGESFFVVAQGTIALRAVKRGDGDASAIRTASAGDSFGEESTIGLARRATAIAGEAATIAEIPVALFRRAAARSGKAEVAERIERTLRRSAARDLLATLALTRDLPARDVDVLLDSIEHRKVERGEHVFREGDASTHAFVVADGLVQIQTDDGEKLHVRAYVGKGDLFGDAEALAGLPRTTSAVASGPSALVALPARALRDLDARHPELFERLRKLAADQRAAQEAVFDARPKNATQHLFRDLYRLQVARSLLVIDLERCVRCGHCAWSCAELHDGVARLVRRGDRLVGRLDDRREEPTSLLLPNSCQHCENPACMADCPTGAIGRDPSSEVFIRDALCTGCGACAKACPWDNIQMAPRPKDAPKPASRDGGLFDELAVKCDLCRGYEGGPGCVEACPVDAIVRVHPNEDLAELRALFDPAERSAGRAKVKRVEGASRSSLVIGALVAASAIAIVGSVMQARGAFVPSRGVGLVAGVASGAGMIALAAYAVPKRLMLRWKAKRTKDASDDSKVKSKLRGYYDAHLAIGIVTVALALVHAPPLFRAASSAIPFASSGVGVALELALLAASILGALLGLAYAFLPSRLARVERTAALPEDFAAAERALHEKLYRDVSGKSELVKKIFEKVLLPYAKNVTGPLALIASGRRLREEEAKLEARIETILEGRGKERLGGLSALVRTVVEMRALPAQRLLSRTLRVFLLPHVVAFTIALALLVLHVLFVARRG